VTTCEPGASEVLTHGLTLRPFSTAFLATRPAPTSTDGFEVLVHEVIARSPPSRRHRTSAAVLRTSTACPSARFASGGGRRLRVASLRPASAQLLGSQAASRTTSPSAHAVLRALRAGHARLDGRQVELQHVGVDRLGRLGRVEQPWRACRPRPARPGLVAAAEAQVASVSASIGKMPQVAPYSGAMLAIVARSASDRCRGPGRRTRRTCRPRRACAASG
jgi:hypothetical protein